MLSTSEEADPYFPHVALKPNHVCLVSAAKQIVHSLLNVNQMTTLSRLQGANIYDAYTEDNSIILGKTTKLRHPEHPYYHSKVITPKTIYESKAFSPHCKKRCDTPNDRQSVDSDTDQQPADPHIHMTTSLVILRSMDSL